MNIYQYKYLKSFQISFMMILKKSSHFYTIIYNFNTFLIISEQMFKYVFYVILFILCLNISAIFLNNFLYFNDSIISVIYIFYTSVLS